ncbi:transcriptional attenuator, LytR family [Longilinea arvoryzae]|uniref:Transcriptional attenuator, LytR family n=1 Tax=Longilinea arvoryzae TaxID=360412 RepID=A0A0S7BNX6_9CHLR|nr:LCP family protein [Longilinea arvoryzae]GAP15482.1 transcriptional attenuator, LytR family [Longilinea arvoryzae]
MSQPVQRPPTGNTVPAPTAQKTDPLSYYQPIPVTIQPLPPKRRKWGWWLVALVLIYFLAPLRTNLLVLGTDRTEGVNIGRSDTIILMSVVPLAPNVVMLSIPRDLWVTIPGYGEQRINTAHFFAEAQQPGSGPQAAMNTIEANFGVHVSRYISINFDGFVEMVDAVGGVDVELEHDEGGLTAGKHHLDAGQALAFARERYTSDDFHRMKHGQMVIRAAALKMANPVNWYRWPKLLAGLSHAVQTNLPIYDWPRLGFAVLRAALTNTIDSHVLDRDYVTPTITDEGADILMPNWDAIRPLIVDLFAP